MILQYIADHAPGTGLAPAAGTMERYRVMEWLNFITSELHKGFSPLFNPKMPQEAKEIFAARLKDKFAYVDRAARRQGLPDGRAVLRRRRLPVHGDQLWAEGRGVDLSGFKNVEAFSARMKARPAVQDAMKAEGLIK